jgi:hypothetical protein
MAVSLILIYQLFGEEGGVRCELISGKNTGALP